MRFASFFTACMFAPLLVSAADTAYTALRAVGKQRGQGLLERVVEVRGRAGAPEPAVWKIIVDEPAAAGGIREFDVQGGRIIGERAPARPGSQAGAAMNLNQLNLDSDGAFTVANDEMKKTAVPFDRIDYVLRSGSRGGAPVWRVDMLHKGARAGTMEIAADTGTVLQRDMGREPREVAQPREYRDDRRYVEEPPPDYDDRPRRRREPREYDDRGVSRSGEPFRGIGDFFERLGRRAERRAHQFENFFTGRGGSREGEREDDRRRRR